MSYQENWALVLSVEPEGVFVKIGAGGGVRSMTTVRSPDEPVLPAASVCVAVTRYVPAAESVGAVGNDHVPDAVQGTVAVWTAVPVIDACTDGESPADVPQAPPNDVTVAIQALKVGHLSGEGAFNCGRIVVADVGIPVRDVDVFMPTARDVRGVLPEQENDTHKYRVGALAVELRFHCG